MSEMFTSLGYLVVLSGGGLGGAALLGQAMSKGAGISSSLSLLRA